MNLESRSSISRPEPLIIMIEAFHLKLLKITFLLSLLRSLLLREEAQFLIELNRLRISVKNQRMSCIK